MNFKDIPAHENVKRQLRDMVADGRVPHALLLHGPAGSGKFMLARVFAQYLHCEHPTSDGEPCGTCPACIQHQTFNHVDTLFVEIHVRAGCDEIAELLDIVVRHRLLEFFGLYHWIYK